MITGIPNRKDFEEQGLTLLNLAWDTVADLFLLFADAENECGVMTEAEKNRHLVASHRSLAIATAPQRNHSARNELKEGGGYGCDAR